MPESADEASPRPHLQHTSPAIPASQEPSPDGEESDDLVALSTDILCCPVSQDPYAPAGPRRPRILPCGHSVSHVSLAAILRQACTAKRRCPICRQQLSNTNATSYPLNLAVLDLLGAPEDGVDEHACPACKKDAVKLPTIATQAVSCSPAEPSGPPTPQPFRCDVRCEDTSAEPVRPREQLGLDLCDEEAPARAAEAAAALFPGEQWLAERAGVRLAAVGLIPALRASHGVVPDTVWHRAVARYRLPEAFVNKAVEGGGRPPPERSCARLACECSDVPSRPTLAVHYHRLRPPHTSAASPSFAQSAESADPLSSRDFRKAALPYVVPQLLPVVCEHMLPLLGFFAERGQSSGDVATGGWAARGPLRRDPLDAHSHRVGFVYADLGESLTDRYVRSQPSGDGMPFEHVASILCQLASLLTLCHDSRLPAERFCPLRPSSIRVLPAQCSPDGGAASDVVVRLAPAPLEHDSGSFCRSTLPKCLQDADELCTPDLIALDPHACECMRTDVWRLGALGAVLLCMHVYGEEAPRQLARAGTAQLLLADVASAMAQRDDCGILDALRGCLHEDPRERWPAGRVHDAMDQVARKVRERAAMLLPPAPQRVHRCTTSTAAGETRRSAQTSALQGGQARARVVARGTDGGRQDDADRAVTQPAGRCQLATAVRVCSCGCVLCFVLCAVARIVAL